jgi:CubicO group peptidase (beta-lactamase class C family)
VNQTSRCDELFELFRMAQKKDVFNGCIGVYENGKPLLEAGFGLSDFQENQPLTPDSCFDLASITKQFTTAAIMLLRDWGRLSLDDEMEKFFPGFPYKDVTVRMLMNHTSGLPDEDWVIPFLEDKTRPIDNQKLLDVIMRQPAAPLFAPGQGWFYSNIAYELLASIIELASGRNFEEFVQTELLDKAGMSHSRVHHRFSGIEDPSGMTKSYLMENGEMVEPQNALGRDGIIPLEGVNGAGLIYTTIGDMNKWDRALRAGTVLSPETQREMREDLADCGNGERYGFGWLVKDDGTLIYHSGSWPGYINYFYRYLDSDRMLIMLTNVQKDRRALMSLLNRALAILTDAPRPDFKTAQDEVNLSIAPDQVLSHLGDYEGGAKVRTHGAGICLVFDGEAAIPLYPLDARRFITTQNMNEYHFDGQSLTIVGPRSRQTLQKTDVQ